MARLVITSKSDSNHKFDFDVTIAYSKPPKAHRPQQDSVELLDGSFYVQDRGQTIKTGELRLLRMTPDEYLRLRTLIEDELRFKARQFTITGIDGIDLGQGRGIGLDFCNFNADDSDIFEHKAPDIYNCTFPYRYVKEKQ